MIRPAAPADLPALQALLASANDEPYDLGAVAGEKCFGDGIWGEPAVRVWGDFEGASVTCGKYVRLLVVSRAGRRRGVGTELLAEAEARGAKIIAAEPGNYFVPGISHPRTQWFLQSRGYVEKASTWNLDVSLSSSGNDGRAESTAVRPTHDDASRVLAFVEREFGRIWRFEAAKAFDTEIAQIFVTQERGAITGFAAHDVNNRGLAFFGPTGVSKEMRGRGLGCQLLLASLADLRLHGYTRAVIPWTDALEFYRKCSGAKPAHQFVAFEKPEP